MAVRKKKPSDKEDRADRAFRKRLTNKALLRAEKMGPKQVEKVRAIIKTLDKADEPRTKVRDTRIRKRLDEALELGREARRAKFGVPSPGQKKEREMAKKEAEARRRRNFVRRRGAVEKRRR